jgi:hypothetical protein
MNTLSSFLVWALLFWTFVTNLVTLICCGARYSRTLLYSTTNSSASQSTT